MPTTEPGLQADSDVLICLGCGGASPLQLGLLQKMLQTLLQKRSNGYYYFRWVCPPAVRKVLGKREIIKSLRTTSKIQALARAGSYYMAIDKLKEISATPLNERMSLETGLQLLDSLYAEIYEKTVTPAFITFLKLCELYRVDSLEDSRKKQADLLKLIEAHRIAATNRLGEYQEGLSIFDRVKQILQKVSQLRQSNLTTDYFKSALAASDEMSMAGLYAATELGFYSLCASSAEIFSESDRWYDRFIYELTQVLFRSYEIKMDNLDPAKVTPSIDFLSSAPVTPVDSISESLRFAELFEEFLSHKIAVADLSPSIQKEYRNYFPLVLHLIGDIPVNAITKRQVKGCLEKYSLLAKRNKKPYNKMNLLEFLSANVPEADRVASKTVGQV